MVESFGKHVVGRLVEIPTVTLGESVPEKIYELHIKTDGVSNAEEVVTLLAEKLYNEFKAKAIWAEVDGAEIKLQIIGSPFVWALLIPFIPAILALLGITTILISVYSVFAAIPGWAWGLLVVGVVLIFAGPTIGKAFVVE